MPLLRDSSRTRSASTSSSTSRAGAPSTRARTSATAPSMSRKRMRPSRNACTAASFAALNAHGNVPPRSPASRASASSGNASRSGSWNSSVSPPAKSSCGKRRRSRPGYVRAKEIGTRMSGYPRCASARTVAKAHDRVHDRRRVDDDLDRVVRQVEEEVRLDQLEALVRERRRVDRDLRPHLPGRMRERVRAASRPPARRGSARGTGRRDAVRTSPSDLVPRHVSEAAGTRAECSLSTGSSSPPPRAHASRASSPAATRLSLFASASVTPRSSAQSVAWMPAKPTIAFRTTSGCVRSSTSVASPPTCVSGASPSIGVEPDVAATSSSSGFAAITSSAWRPIEPVTPRTAIRRFTGSV